MSPSLSNPRPRGVARLRRRDMLPDTVAAFAERSTAAGSTRPRRGTYFRIPLRPLLADPQPRRVHSADGRYDPGYDCNCSLRCPIHGQQLQDPTERVRLTAGTRRADRSVGAKSQDDEKRRQFMRDIEVQAIRATGHAVGEVAGSHAGFAGTEQPQTAQLAPSQ